VIGLFAIVAAIAVVGVVLVWRPQIDPIEAPKANAFNRELVTKGAQIAAIGNCIVCHTKQGGAAYAGSRALPTPFGTIYSSNITPDPDTGIGRWSEDAFRRAMRDGVDRKGRHLYPAFPYDHFTHLTDEDIRALYTFMMTRDPVHLVIPENKLAFPFNIRPLIAGWNLLFLRRGSIPADIAQTTEWNRGAYLVESAAHCGACHTPRNILGAEKKSQAYDGSTIEGWVAPALNFNSPAPVTWTAEQLFEYLRTGWQAKHGAAVGPMVSVTDNLADASDEDIRAIAVYIASLSKGRENETAQPREPNHDTSAAATIYAGACAVCHDRPAGLASQSLPLTLSSALREPQPRNTINVILHGVALRPGEPGPFMPAFGNTLSDKQIADVAAYLRGRFTDEPTWGDMGSDIESVRKGNAS
jgi:mono/diheme cytochrome c family protein